MNKTRLTLWGYLRKNLAYILIAVSLMAIGLSVALVLSNKDSNIKQDFIVNDNPIEQDVGDITEGDDTPVVEIVSYAMPVLNASEIADYTTQMTYNSTLNRYEIHNAVDFFSEEGTSVFAVSDGIVESVTSSLLQGVTITIDHGNGLKSVYNSLCDDVLVLEGQSVEMGDEIGQVGLTNRQEFKEGAHLHFSMIENGQVINPSKYLDFDNK